MRIAYEKEAAKHIQAQDKPTRQRLKATIEDLPNGNIETIYNIITKFIPEDTPLPDEIEAIERVNKSIAVNGTIPHDAINWD